MRHADLTGNCSKKPAAVFLVLVLPRRAGVKAAA